MALPQNFIQSEPGFGKNFNGSNQDGDNNRKKIPFRRVAFLFLLALIFFIILSLTVAYHEYGTVYSTSTAKKTFVIKPGDHSSDVIDALADQGFIQHPRAAKFFSYLSGDSKKIKPGSYLISPSMTARQIITEFVTASAQDFYTVRILEGWSNREIGQYLEQNNFSSSSDFSEALKKRAAIYGYLGEVAPSGDTNLEGYIFPDTYFVSKKNTADDLIAKALQNFDKKISVKMLTDLRASGKTLYQVVTLASIIEKEVGRNVSSGGSATATQLDNERKIVASVFYNRLNAGMPLQSDATIAYALNQKIAAASAEQTKINSPYNTYKFTGLPPGPISNPSLSSIMAAIYPAQTDYVYFLMKPDGTAVFAKTLDEQNANKAKYLK